MASAAAESRISSWMQDRIIALVDRSDELIYLSQLRVKYRERYEEELDVEVEGFGSLSHLINAIEGVSVTLRDGKKGTEHLTRTSGDAQQLGLGTCAPPPMRFYAFRWFLNIAVHRTSVKSKKGIGFMLWIFLDFTYVLCIVQTS